MLPLLGEKLPADGFIGGFDSVGIRLSLICVYHHLTQGSYNDSYDQLIGAVGELQVDFPRWMWSGRLPYSGRRTLVVLLSARARLPSSCLADAA